MDCRACGRPVPEGAKFCPECAAPLTLPANSAEQRKTVTALFCDVTGSTALGERLDPDTMRRVLARFFDTARAVIESHGGTVQKYIGDAVMAVFGVPVLHEDDALRAVRAAAEINGALRALNDELDHDHGVTLQVRTGVNTGEVVTATDQLLAMGDAVNVAARLQHLAAPGEVLLGESVVRLVRNSVEVVSAGPTELKGKSQPVAVYRLVAVHDSDLQAARHHEAPLVGRTHELHLLSEAAKRVVREQSSGLFTLLGAAGVGKTRLVDEFVSTLDAIVVRGRCLSYGEGITYWPVVEVVKALLAVDDVAELLPQERAVDAGVAALMGEAQAATSSSEIAWAVRKVLERAATARPLVVVFDDLHWGEPTLFDLIEHVTDLSRSAPIFLLCVGRPELLERRPTWGGGKLNATALLLEPLDADETETLIDELLVSREALSPKLRARVREAAGGNPLFVEEILALAAESGSGDVDVPPSIHALLAARLDQLESPDRHVLQRGAVEGQSFHAGAVLALSPGELEVPTRLVGLVRKDLIRPDRATLPGEDAFRFRHLLIRDAAYDGLAKSVRADLHARFADWLKDAAPDLVELDEIVGYHLEQSVRYRGELGPVDGATQSLAAVASSHLAAAGLRAFDRGDVPGALNLLDRAAALHPAGEVDVALELVIVEALGSVGRLDAAVARARGAAKYAAARGDRVGELKARLGAASWALQTEPERALEEHPALIDEARRVFGESPDDAALAYLWLAIAYLEHIYCRFASGFDAAVKGVEHAEAAGLRWLANQARTLAAAEAIFGPMPVREAVAWLDELQSSSAFYLPWIDDMKAPMLALEGQREEARLLADKAEAAWVERGETTGLALSHMARWNVEAASGDHLRAERVMHSACEEFEAIGERSWLSTAACGLAESLYQLGRYDGGRNVGAAGTRAGSG